MSMFNGFMRKFTGKESPKDTAKKRLEFALFCDNLEIDGHSLSSLQKDIVEVISKYFEIDTEALQLEVQQKKDASALVFNTPIKCVKKGRMLPK